MDTIFLAIGFFVSMYVGGPVGKKITDLKNESLNKESKLLENLSVLVEKNVLQIHLNGLTTNHKKEV